MTKKESINIKIDEINKIFQSSIEDKSIFDDAFKDHTIHIKKDDYGPPKYKGRSVECPVYQNPFEYDVTKKFSKKRFDSFKKTVNNCILLNALGNLLIFNKLLKDGFNESDNIYNKIFTTFAHKKDPKSTELFMKSVGECNADMRIYVVHALIFSYLNTNEVRYSIRVGTEFEFEAVK